MRALSSLPLLAVALSPLLAGANGTSVGASRGSPLGGIVPLQNTQVRLVGEKLTITLREGATCVKHDPTRLPSRSSCTTKHYDVVARYTLANPTRAASLLYGVPLIARPEQMGAMAKSVRITLAGRQHRCTVPARPPEAPASLTDAEAVGEQLRKEGRVMSELMAWQGAWCVAPITIPRGERVALELRYTGELLWDDWDGPGCAFFDYARHLYYPLAPAGYWAGRPEAIDLRVELGAHAALTRVAGPAGHTRSPTAVTWRLVRPELKKVAPLHLVLDLTWHQHQRVAAMNEAWVGGLTAGPASRARRLVDGKHETSSCADPDPSGGVELRIAEHPYWYTNVYLELRNATAQVLASPRAMPFPRGVTALARTPASPGELELHGRLPGPLWGKRPELGFALVPARGADPPRAVTLRLCDRAEPSEEIPLAASRLEGPGPERGRRVITVARPSGELRELLLARLDAWSQELIRAARPCVATGRARCKPSAGLKRGERDEAALACRLKVEQECVHAAAQAAAPARRPCIRFELGHGAASRGKRPPAARGPACLAELVPLFGPRCGAE